MKKLFFFAFFVSQLVTTICAQTSPLCVAHRANYPGVLENSMQAFKNALEVGAEAVEFDVRHTRDKRGIIMHDGTLARTSRSRLGKRCPLNTSINQLSYAEINENCELINGEPIPSLRDVLLWYLPFKTLLFVEFKDSPTKSSLTELDLFYHLREHVINPYNAGGFKNAPFHLISFSNNTLQKVFEVRKKKGLWSHTQLYLLSLVLLGKFTLPSGFKNLDGIDVHILPDKKTLKELRRKNKRVGVWTYDKRNEMLKAGSQVDFITTNNLSLCQSLFKI